MRADGRITTQNVVKISARTIKHMRTQSKVAMTVSAAVFSVDESCTSKEWHAVLDIGGRGLKVKIDTGGHRVTYYQALITAYLPKLSLTPVSATVIQS